LLFGALLGAQIQASLSPDDAIEQFKKMKQAFVLISGKYVEQVRPSRLAEGGVKGMLERLDPHSRYVPPEEVARKREQIRGSFGGIGIRFDILDDTARVVSPIKGGPSEKAGIMAGDRIVEIEDSTAIGLSDTGLRRRLTGQKGTEVTFTIYRPLSGERRTLTIERGEIPLYSINSSYMIDDRTGYVEIGRFAQSTHNEFLKKTDALKKQGMERLVLDLRGNAGGVMESAIKIADEMLGTPGLTIVEMKGRSAGTNQTWRTQSGGALAGQPVTVLVNGNTASASEILAGALQDHDRALLVGRRTFGKGLVQEPFSLSDGSLLTLTVGAYYTPIGRFIQTPYEEGQKQAYYEQKFADQREAVYNVREYKESIPDSLTYRTKHGRTVFGGGGILPDYVVQPDTTSLTGFLRREGLDSFFGFFVTEWFPEHDRELRRTWQNRSDDFLSSYQVSPETVDEFWTYAEEQDILTLASHPDSVDVGQQVFSDGSTKAARSVVRTHVKGQLANVLFGSGTGTPLLNKVDLTVQKAQTLWSSSRELAHYHTSSSAVRDDE
jgi:carboxyl-terminal processing protease